MENQNETETTEPLERRKVSITKQELAELPAAKFPGNVILVDKDEDVEAAVEALNAETIIGFDTETRPSFRRGQTYLVSLLQLSTHTDCYLFRLNRIGLPQSVKDILENPKILKIGVSIHDDFHNLNKLCEIKPKGFVELQSFVKDYEILDNSLSRIYGILFGQRISKGQRLTNWEANELSLHQQEYASLDAYACIQIYEHLNNVGFDPTLSPYYRIIEEVHSCNPADGNVTSQQSDNSNNASSNS